MITADAESTTNAALLGFSKTCKRIVNGGRKLGTTSGYAAHINKLVIVLMSLM